MFGFSDHFQFCFDISPLINLMINLPVPSYLQVNKFGEGVDHREPHPMETSGDLVAAVIKFASRVEFGHYNIDSRTILFLVEIDGNAPAVISDGNAVIDMNDHVDLGTISLQGFINAVIHQFMNQMVKAFDSGISNINRRPFAAGCQSFQDLDLLRIIFFSLFFHPFSLTTSW